MSYQIKSIIFYCILGSNTAQNKDFFSFSSGGLCLRQSGCVCLCVSIRTCKRPGSPRHTSISAYMLQGSKCEMSAPVSSAWGKIKDADTGGKETDNQGRDVRLCEREEGQDRSVQQCANRAEQKKR